VSSVIALLLTKSPLSHWPRSIVPSDWHSNNSDGVA
jgi:hypothetical protein